MVFRLLPSILIYCLVLGLTTAALNDNVCKTSLTTSGILAKATVSTSNSIGFQNGAWCGTQNSQNWIEFDFGAAIAVRGIEISKPNTGYVQSFYIQYVGLQGTALQNYGNDPNHATVINALDERHTSTSITLTGVVLKKIRINIESYKTAPCLKLDLLGCTNPDDICPSGCQNGGQCFFEESCACPAGYEGQQCQTPISHSGECVSQLGMGDSRIPDSALSVSSSRLGHGKEKARYGCCTNEAHGAWCPANTDQNPWYEVKFDKPQSVGGLDFLHPTHPPGVVPSEYLKTFELQYWSALDSQETWRFFSKDIPAIYNDTLYYTIQLTPSITVKAIRIIPQTFKSAPCIRFDVLGCDPKVLCPANFCKNGGSCVGLNTCTCHTGFVGNQCEKPASQVVTINAGFQAIVNQVLQTTTTIKFTVHGNVQLVPGVTGQAVHITSSAQYLTIDNNGFTSCLKNIDSCTGGFTISTHVKLETLTDNTYIISSGANNPNTKGIALYFQNNQLHFVVSTSTQKWHLSTSYHLTLNTWHHIELSWQKNLGCELIDNGKLVGSVTKPLAHHATIVHQIAIGHGYTATTSTHISMKVEGLTTVDANRASLAIAGILPTEGTTVATTHTTRAPTTTTTTLLTTIPTTHTKQAPTIITTVPTTIPTTQTTAFVCGDKQVNFDFMDIKDNILVTPQYNFTVHKNPVIRREDHGKAVLVLNTTGQYVELPNMGLECIQDMTKCDNGFTLSLEIKWLDMNSTNKRYIFSSGGDTVNNSGIALYLWQNELYCSAKKDHVIWTAKEKLNVKPGEWHSYQVSWNKQDGFIVFLDGKFFMKNTIKLPNPAQNGVHPLLIAASPVHTDTSLMEVRNLYTWTASRDVLINHTCITEFPTVEPTTMTTPATSITSIKTYDLNFIKISHNILTTSSFNLTVHGNAHLEHHSIQRHPVLVLNGSNQYVELNNSEIHCMHSLSGCQSGFTITVEVNLIKFSHEYKTVIFSNTDPLSNGTGFALYLEHGHLVSYVSTNKTWKVDVDFKVEVNKWHTYQMSWSMSHGLTIIVDGHQVGSSTHTTTNSLTSMSHHTLTIGKPFLTSYTTSMKVTSLLIWQASHEVLIQQGVITTAMTTPSTTSIPSIKTYDLNFIKISHNVLTTSSFNLTVHGTAHLDHHSIQGHAVLVLNGSNQYVELNNSEIQCMHSLSGCQSGFTIKIEVNLIKFSHEYKTVIFSNTDPLSNGTGFALYLEHKHLVSYVSTNKTWKVDVDFKVEVNKWHTYQMSWSMSHGLTIIVDGHQVGSSTHTTTNSLTSVSHHTLTIGKPFSTSYTTSMKVTSLLIWQASHEVLIQQGVITTAQPTTTTTAMPTTTKTPIPSYEWSFITKPHGNTVIGTKFNATLQGSFQVNATGINFNNNHQYIDLGIHNDICFGNLSLCSCGITIQVTVMFTRLEENTVIISSGAEKTDGTGLAMVYRYGEVHCMVSTSTDTWFSTIKREKLAFHYFHQIIISWSPGHGLKVIVDSHVISSVTTSIKHEAITSSTEHMYIGNPPSFGSTSSCNYFMSSVIIWHCWIDNVVGEGHITPPVTVPVTTVPPKTQPQTTPVRTFPPTTTDFCKSGYVCKDDLSTQGTWKPTKPVTTSKATIPTQPTTVKPIVTSKPTAATVPKTTKPTPKLTTAIPTTQKPTTQKPTTPKPTTPRPTTPKPTTPKQTTPRPTRPSYIAIPHLKPGVSATGEAHFKCQFEKSKESNVEFIVCLNIGSKTCAKQVLVSGTYEEVIFTITEINQNLFQLQITCSVKARFKGQILVTVIKTSNIITPNIQLVTTGTITLTEGHPVQHLIVKVTAPPQMFCCQGCQGRCQVTITTHSNYERFYQRCERNKYIGEVLIGWAGTSQSPNAQMCGTTVTHTTHISSWEQTIKIPIKATVDGRIDRNTNNKFTVQAHVVNQPKPPVIAQPHTINIGHVQIHANNNDHRAQCKSLNDPHMTTFDGRRYDNHNGGEFIMYRHTTLPYEVRGFYTKCSSRSNVYCNCGAAIKSGDDVITFSTCNRPGNNGQGHGHGHHHHSYPSRIDVEMYKNGELTPGTQILRIGCGQKYQVILPTGTVVTIQSSGSSFINIWINPSSVDRGHTEGLCGSYDGNNRNDVHNVQNRPDYNKRPQWFCMHWKASQSIFYGVAPAKFDHIHTFCSCIDGKDVQCYPGHGVAYCTRSRYDITSTILRQAKIPHVNHRGRRSLVEDDTALVTTAAPEVEGNATYTLDEAREKCQSIINSSKAVKTCWDTVNTTDHNTSLDNCAADLNETGSEVWATGYINDIVEECLSTLAKTQEIENGTVVTPDAINETALCQPGCGDHGSCVEGVCRCSSGFSGLLCDISAADTVPDIDLQRDDCGCDKRITDDCNTITVYGGGFVDSGTLTCFYEYTESPLYDKPKELRRSVLANYVSITQVTCTLPEVRQGVYVTVSNNGKDFGPNWFKHLVYDSKCYDCKQTGKSSPPVEFVRKDHICMINGECFGSDEKKTGDTCKVCDPSNAVNKWTESSDKSCRCSSETDVQKVTSDEDDTSKNTVTILAVVIGILAFITMVSLFYNCKMRSKRSLYEKSKGYDVNNGYEPQSFQNIGYTEKSELSDK